MRTSDANDEKNEGDGDGYDDGEEGGGTTNARNSLCEAPSTSLADPRGQLSLTLRYRELPDQ